MEEDTEDSHKSLIKAESVQIPLVLTTEATVPWKTVIRL